MSCELLSGVTVGEVGTGAAVGVASRLLAQLGASVTRGSSAAGGARIVLLDPSTPFDEAASDDRIIACVEMEADDLLLQARRGICAGIGEPNRPPLKLPLDQSAQQGGLTCAIAVCAALFTPDSQRIDLSVGDVWTTFYSGPDVANAHFGRGRTRRGGHRAFGVPWPRTILPCKDGFFAVQCATREHWQRFLRLVGKPDLESSPLFADRIKANDEHGDDAEALFASWFGARAKEELAREFLDAKIPGAPVYTIDEVAMHGHLRQRAAFDDEARPNPPFSLHDAPSTASEPNSSASPASPLAGIRVVDFGWVWAGAVPGAILADLGAEVIKIETATHLDYMRQGRPVFGTQRDPEQNPMFAAVNRGKLSFRVDMTKPQGAELLRELIATSDIVIENFSPGVLDRYELGWRTLSNIRPGLIMCSMSAAGATGSFRDIRTYATMIAGLCGLDSMVGYPGERVIGSQSSYCDPNASLHATLAILAALFRRRRAGTGCWIDLSQWQAGLHTVQEALARYAADGTVPRPNGLQREDRLVHGCFPTSTDDGWIAVSLRDERELDVIRAALEAPPFPPDDIAIVTARFSLADLERKVPSHLAAPVRKPEELRDQDLFENVAHPVLGTMPVYRLPWRVDGMRLGIRSRAPLLGEHNERILHAVLGISTERVASLTESGVLN